MSRKCCKCQIIKPATAFHKSKKDKSGLAGYCKPCSSKNRAEWGKENRDNTTAVAKEWVHTWPVSSMLSRAKRRAIVRDVVFAISAQDITIPPYCPVLGVKLTWRGDYDDEGPRPGPRPSSATLDRIVPSLGYVPGNVRVISHRANTIKNDATADELEAVARYARSAYADALASVDYDRLAEAGLVPGVSATPRPKQATVEPVPASPVPAKSKPQVELFPGFTWTKKVA